MKAPSPRLACLRYCLLLSLGCAAPFAHGAITLDGTLGPAGSLNGPHYAVTSDLGRQLGGNLFHSFGGFSLGNGESAIFSGPASVANIIGRVTGGSVSTIDGVLGSTISGANLYLVNPSGLIFGPNAALDISGSFYASTASYVRLADGGRFDAAVPVNSTLTAAPPAAFGFLSSAPAPISVQGASLAVGPGQSLALIGGNIDIDDVASLWVPGGRVVLVGGASAGETDPAGNGSFSAGGNIILHGASTVDVSADSGGSIVIRGGRLQMEDARLVASTVNGNGGSIDIAVTRDISLTAGAEITTNSTGAGAGGNINLSAGDAVTIVGMTLDENYSAIRANARDAGDAGHIQLVAPRITLDEGLIQSLTIGQSGGPARNGNGGSILIQATSLSLLNGGQLDSGSRSGSNGNGGSVDISASESVTISGIRDGRYPSAIFANLKGDGAGGHISIRSPVVVLENGADIAVSTSGAGNSGYINIEAQRLALTSGGQVSANTSATGAGGSVNISASESILLSGQGADGSYSAIRVNTNGAGNGGSVNIGTGVLTIDGGLIQALTYGERVAGGQNGSAGNVTIRAADAILLHGGQIDSGSRDQSNGNGGYVDIRASGSLVLDGVHAAGHPSGIFAKTEGDGAGGYVSINVSHMALENGANLAVSASGAGAGGYVQVEVGSLEIVNGGLISASTTGSGAGGYLDIRASDKISMSGRAADGSLSSILAITSGTGDGGNIILSAPRISLNDAVIKASTSGDLGQGVNNGNAGYVSIDAGGLTLTNGAQIDSSSRNDSTGDGGAVIVVASDSISVSGLGVVHPSAIFANTFGSGEGGFIYLETPRLTVDNGAYIQAAATGSGNGGYVLISVGQLSVSNGGTVSAATYGSGAGGYVWIDASESVTLTGQDGSGKVSSITAQTTGYGEGGYILIQTPQLRLNGAEISSSSSGGGAGGLIDIVAARELSLENGAKIESRGSGAGDAGSILIETGIFTSRHSAVTTEATYASGGNIELNAAAVRLSDQSAISATVGGGYGDGGNVTLSARGIAAADNSDITARADQGYGGRITINAEAFLRGKDVDLDASSNVIGNEGVVEVNAPKLDISGSLVVLSSAFLDASGLLNDPCVASHASQESSFVIRGRGGVASQPDSSLPSSMLLDPFAPSANKALSLRSAPRPAWKNADCKQSSLLWKEDHL